jgi:potassium/chloride transporter 9
VLIQLLLNRKRVRSLLDNLRVPASLRVFSLASGQIVSYECIVRGKESTPPAIETVLGGDVWWEALKALRMEDEQKKREAASKKHRPQPVPSISTTPKKQSKKEKKMMGVSLPREHLEYFKRNMQIGLAHPRSSKRRRQGESAQDSESEYEDSDSGGDLSDELAGLDWEDVDWISGGSPGVKRSQSFSVGGRNGGANTKELHRRATGVAHTSKGARRASVDQSHSGKRSEWGASSDGPSMQSLVNRKGSDVDYSSSYGSMSTTPRPAMYQNRSASSHPTTIQEGKELGGENDDRDNTLKASDRAKVQSKLLKAESHQDSRHRSSSASSQRDSVASESSADEDGATSQTTLHPADHINLPFVSFNSLPNKAQYLILK